VRPDTALQTDKVRLSHPLHSQRPRRVRLQLVQLVLRHRCLHSAIHPVGMFASRHRVRMSDDRPATHRSPLLRSGGMSPA
jgi:hypothetical protein